METDKTGSLEFSVNAVSPDIMLSRYACYLVAQNGADLINRCNLGKGGLKELFFGDCTKIHAFFKGCKAEKADLL